jgi:hypothetical protein
VNLSLSARIKKDKPLTWMNVMNIWNAREKSYAWLKRDLFLEGRIIQEGFDYLGEFVNLFEKIAQSEASSEKGKSCRVWSITLAKISHLLIGCFSLILDGLAQESGALLRPIIEIYEILVYLRLDTSRLSQVIDDSLPSAGAIGKEISGDYQELRKYLNDNASHFSYKENTIRHLFDEDDKVRSVPNHSLMVLRKNIQLLNAFQISILDEALNCLYLIDVSNKAVGSKMEKWRKSCIDLFSN